MDLKVDELTFPKIYCGKQRKIKENIKLTYAKIAKSELRMFDRRCGRVSKLFFTYKKLQTRKFCDAISINLRKTKNTSNVTVAQMLNRDYVTGLIHNNDAFTFLRCDRSSAAFWELKKRSYGNDQATKMCNDIFNFVSGRNKVVRTYCSIDASVGK